MQRSTLRSLASLLPAALVLAATLPLNAQIQAAQQLTPGHIVGALPGTLLKSPTVRTQPALLTAAEAAPFVTRLAATEPGQHLQLALQLPLRNQADLDATLADIYNPASPNFHHFLTTPEFDRRFGPTPSDFATLVDWAERQGFTVTHKSSNNRIVDVDASVYAINRAFHTNITQYHDAHLNRDFHAPAQEPSTVDLPVQLYAIAGLDDAAPKHSHLKKGDELVEGTHQTRAQLATSAIVGSGPGNTYLPSDMRAAYYGGTALTGAGQTVAVYSYDGYQPSDVTAWYTHVGIPASTVPVTTINVNGYNSGCYSNNSTTGVVIYTTCDDTEQVLDILQVQGMAPGLSKILFYVGNSATDIVNQIASDNLAPVITSSWGGGDFGPTCDPAFQQMALQGQTYLNATGDSGGFNASTYDAPSLDPYIVQVGGTDLITTVKAGPWKSETGWADSGGGFYAGTYAIPSWQQATGIITTTNKGSTTYRNAPDIAAEANFDNTSEDNGAFETGYGGTSYATPRMAGYLALANQQAYSYGATTGVGFINPSLYTAGLSATASTVYHDITSGSNKSSSTPYVTYTATAGYDLVTGWGSPNTTGLINVLAPQPPPNFTFTGDTSALTIVRGSTGSSVLTVTGTNGFTAATTFSTSTLPTGVTGAFSPVSTTGSGTTTLTFTTDPTSPISTTPITITATSGTLTQTLSINLIVDKRTDSDFSLAATSATTSVTQGATNTNTVNVTVGNSLLAPVNLTISNLPTGVTASFNPTTNSSGQAASFSSTLTFTASASAAVGSTTVVVTGTSNNLVHTTTVVVTVVAPPSNQLIVNPGFENGSAPWYTTPSVYCTQACVPYGESPHSGVGFIWFGGYGAANTSTIYQAIAIPSSATTATLNFYLHIDTAETTTTAKNDTMKVQILNSAGTVVATLATYSNLNAATGYALYTLDVSQYIGTSGFLQFTYTENASLQTSFVLDDVTVTIQ